MRLRCGAICLQPFRNGYAARRRRSPEYTFANRSNEKEVHMGKSIRFNILLIGALVACIAAIGRVNADGANGKKQDLIGRIVAVGVPGVSAISPVGAFLPGGPIHDNPAFAAYTQPGRILDPARILVGSRSNFGAALATPGEQEGSFLSIDPRGAAILVIPSDFAAEGGQASPLGGRVQMFSANSPAFFNGVNNPP